MCQLRRHELKCKVWGFHGGDYAEYLLLRCSTVWFRFLPTFRRNVSPPSSGQLESTGSQFSTYCRLVVRVRKYQLWNQVWGWVEMFVLFSNVCVYFWFPVKKSGKGFGKTKHKYEKKLTRDALVYDKKTELSERVHYKTCATGELLIFFYRIVSFGLQWQNRMSSATGSVLLPHTIDSCFVRTFAYKMHCHCGVRQNNRFGVVWTRRYCYPARWTTDSVMCGFHWQPNR
jgi:hypothetical protein